ncbi:protein of unknown function [Vibrio tapetis subsp. tapetis]|uniref:Uncharacterized protein n=1 Tax=Vibrio tapetis subsp. tapetis TaxID=1671868 RepID=A0A2N8ZHM8_9VIBR|nr:protein of unknown function [Vibrio tapetis subsp. tapetis]
MGYQLEQSVVSSHYKCGIYVALAEYSLCPIASKVIATN